MYICSIFTFNMKITNLHRMVKITSLVLFLQSNPMKLSNCVEIFIVNRKLKNDT